MHTIVPSREFSKKVKGKFSQEDIDLLFEKLAANPKLGKKFQAVNNIFKRKEKDVLSKAIRDLVSEAL